MGALIVTLRRYEHPGKFEGGLVIDEYVWEFARDWCDEECGDVSEFGVHHSLVRGVAAVADGVPRDDSCVLTPDEVAFLEAQAGAIVTEDSQGFVAVAYYDNPAELEADWAGYLAETSGESE